MIRVVLSIVLLLPAGIASAKALTPSTKPSINGVMIGPFVSLNRNATTDLLTRGLRANLLVELGRRDDLMPIASGKSFTGDIDDFSVLAREGKKVGAQFAVYASCQQSARELRLLGAVVNCDTAHSIGSLKITGSSDDLFDVQDRFSRQVLSILPQPAVKPLARHSKIVQVNSGPLVDRSRPPPSPWDHPYMDAAAEASLNNLLYQNLDTLGYSSGGLYGGYGGGYGYGFGFFPSTNYNFSGYGAVYGYGLPGARAINQP